MRKNKGTKIKRKATNALKQLAYMGIWREETPKKYKKVKTY